MNTKEYSQLNNLFKVRPQELIEEAYDKVDELSLTSLGKGKRISTKAIDCEILICNESEFPIEELHTRMLDRLECDNTIKVEDLSYMPSYDVALFIDGKIVGVDSYTGWAIRLSIHRRARQLVVDVTNTYFVLELDEVMHVVTLLKLSEMEGEYAYDPSFDIDSLLPGKYKGDMDDISTSISYYYRGLEDSFKKNLGEENVRIASYENRVAFTKINNIIIDNGMYYKIKDRVNSKGYAYLVYNIDNYKLLMSELYTEYSDELNITLKGSGKNITVTINDMSEKEIHGDILKVKLNILTKLYNLSIRKNIAKKEYIKLLKEMLEHRLYYSNYN